MIYTAKKLRTYLAMASASGLGLALLLTGCSATADASQATASQGSGQVSGQTAARVASAAWDSSEVHSIDVDFNEADYQSMLDTYVSTGEKVWISATVTIDGVTFENVGLELKGNSSLRGIGADADAVDLPWLIKLDKFVDGQSNEGATEYAIRSNSSVTGLNEAVALDLLADAGLAAEGAIAVQFSAGGDIANADAGTTAMLRLAVENPTDEWMESALGDGLLYKSEAEGTWDYVDDNPDSYTSSFDQEAGEEDMTPLIEFLKFVNSSDDATFAADLDQYLDVHAFATYLAFQQVVDNFDDIDGPGNNSYLYYEPDTGLVTVVNWDLNLAFGGTPGGMEGVAGQMGGGMPGNGAAAGDGTMPNDGAAPAMPNDGAAPSMPDDASAGRPAGGPQGDDAQTGGPQGGGQVGQVGQNGGGMAGGPGGSNVLSTRFIANTEFAAMVQSEVERLTELFYGDGGAAQASLDAWTAVLTEQAGDVIAADVVEQEATSLAQRFAG